MPRHPTLTAAEYNILWIVRIKARCTITESGCWLWTGTKAYNGYGISTHRSKGCVIHRKMYELANGKLLDRWIYACHKCDERSCCNPEHVFEGTPQDNQVDMSRKRRAAGQMQTHCKHGHEFTPENTYLSDRGRTKARNCRTCHRARFRMRAGWPKDLAYSLTAVPHGYAPVGASWNR